MIVVETAAALTLAEVSRQRHSARPSPAAATR